MISPQVFEADTRAIVSLPPGPRSVWLRQITLREGRSGCSRSWIRPSIAPPPPARGDRRGDLGAAHQLLGPARARTRPAAPLRGIVLGDSFMQGMFIGDDETPPEALARYLAGG